LICSCYFGSCCRQSVNNAIGCDGSHVADEPLELLDPLDADDPLEAPPVLEYAVVMVGVGFVGALGANAGGFSPTYTVAVELREPLLPAHVIMNEVVTVRDGVSTFPWSPPRARTVESGLWTTHSSAPNDFHVSIAVPPTGIEFGAATNPTDGLFVIGFADVYGCVDALVGCVGVPVVGVTGGTGC
jgi:hypothetical protein